MAPDRLTLDVDGQLVEFTDPGKARAAARRWRRMARELDGSNQPDITLKQHELRARAKAAEDWARSNEERQLRSSPPSEAAATSKAGPESPAKKPAGGRHHAPPSRGARQQAAAALSESGVRKARRSASGARRAVRTGRRRYESAGGAPVATSAGEFAIFFAGSIVLLVLLEDVLGKKGSTGLSGATKTAAAIAHRVIAPVPIVSGNQGGT